ncbi:ComEA family DNA-binding protein [Candidatus Aerophobetes bacterium]|uniref:ComEA family DNA-binding protein n=1 Tax=Aerophobetes bacterium TaxID=2030807 RepID=A0A523UXU2_UNCAE|nr:MAG: ComEA family DNA-binding protein [Candidatus Aerophobetes bacterium]
MWNLTREEQIIIFLLLAAFLIGLGIEMRGGIPHTLTPPSPPELIKVKLGGAIRKPGWYTLPKGSSLEEAVNYAGGFLPWANLEDVNLDFSLKDDEEIRIPEGKLDINQASAKELVELPGIGPVLAARIIKYRERKGTFQSFSQVLEVKGIGEVRLQRIREVISLGEEASNHLYQNLKLRETL